MIAALVMTLVAGCSEPPSQAEQQARVTRMIEVGDVDGALAMLGPLVRDNPDDPELLRLHGRALVRAGNGHLAEGMFLRAEKLGTARDILRLDLGRAYNLQGKHRETATLLATESETEAPGVEWLMVRGEAELQLKNYPPDAVMRTFFDLYAALERNPDEVARAWVEDMRSENAIVLAAFRHHRCARGDNITKLASADGRPDATTDARVLRVGPTHRLKAPSAAARVARDGDVIEIDAGVYQDDVAVWTQSDLVLRGVGGMAHMKSSGVTAEDKGIWLFEGRNYTVEHIEFSGARSRHLNGSGIRLHGSNLTVRHSYFHDNENGILGGYGEDTEVLVEFSEFARNGAGDGQSHNIYIGQIGKFTLRHSYSHHANVGHLVKSRARNNHILYNRLMDEDTGNSSYVINLPEGGRAFVIGNELHKGLRAQNPIMLSFGEERHDRPDQALYVVHNTFYSGFADPVFVRNATEVDARLINNLFAGAPGVTLKGDGKIAGDLARGRLGLADPADYDYRLDPDSPAIDAGVDIPDIDGADLTPRFEYAHVADGRPREIVWKPDLGAHEACGSP